METKEVKNMLARMGWSRSTLVPVEVPRDVLDEYVKTNWKKREEGKCQFPEDYAYPCQECTESGDPTKCPYIGTVPVVQRVELPPNWSPMILMDPVTPRVPSEPRKKKKKFSKAQKKQPKSCKQKQ